MIPQSDEVREAIRDRMQAAEPDERRRARNMLFVIPLAGLLAWAAIAGLCLEVASWLG